MAPPIAPSASPPDAPTQPRAYSSLPGAPGRLRTYFAFAAGRLKNGGALPDGPEAPTSQDAWRELLRAIARARGSAVRAWGQLTLRPGTGVWMSTGLQINPGDHISLFSRGTIWLSRLLGVGLEPRTALWVRLRGGPIQKVDSGAMTFQAQHAGELELLIKPPGEWLDESGTLDPGEPLDGLSGEFSAIAVVWEGDPCSGLASLGSGAQGEIVRQALERLSSRVAPPAGWSYLWRLGDGAIFHAEGPDHDRAIRCCTQGDVGILQHPLDLSLRPGTTLRWSWLAERLPSALPEHIQPTHDYLSIAVEFDDGQDLTYVWSSQLPVGFVFRCPLPWWKERETHLVVRSGAADLGRWVDEERDLFDDYRAAIGPNVPSRVVRVWLIAVSVFQRERGVCSYKAISVGDAGGRVRIA